MGLNWDMAKMNEQRAQMGVVGRVASLCWGHSVVLKVFGRFGCPYTRFDAHCLSQLKAQLRTIGAELVGIGFEGDALSLGGVWNSTLFIDPSREVYHHFQLKRTSRLSTVRYFMEKNKFLEFSELKSRSGGSMLLDALQLGGTFVINSKQSLVYSCQQASIGELTDLSAVLEACHAEYMYHISKLPLQPTVGTYHRSIQRRKAVSNLCKGDNFFVHKLSCYSDETLKSLDTEPIHWDESDEDYPSSTFGPD